MQTSNIPKIIHQLWIGPKERPSKFMDTWKKNNPDFEYIFWNEEEIKKRNEEIKKLISIPVIRYIKPSEVNINELNINNSIDLNNYFIGLQSKSRKKLSFST